MSDDEVQLKLTALAQDASLDEATLRARFGDAFLLVGNRGGRLPGQLQTAAVDPRETPTGTTAEPLLVPLTGRRPPVTIGRAKNSDIVVDDASVSTFHCALAHGDAKAGAAWVLYDGGSKNGTFADGERAPQRGQGEPLPLRPGSVLLVGSVDVTFVDATMVLQMARYYASSSSSSAAAAAAAQDGPAQDGPAQDGPARSAS